MHKSWDTATEAEARGSQTCGRASKLLPGSQGCCPTDHSPRGCSLG